MGIAMPGRLLEIRGNVLFVGNHEILHINSDNGEIIKKTDISYIDKLNELDVVDITDVTVTSENQLMLCSQLCWKIYITSFETNPPGNYEPYYRAVEVDIEYPANFKPRFIVYHPIKNLAFVSPWENREEIHIGCLDMKDYSLKPIGPEIGVVGGIQLLHNKLWIGAPYANEVRILDIDSDAKDWTDIIKLHEMRPYLISAFEDNMYVLAGVGDQDDFVVGNIIDRQLRLIGETNAWSPEGFIANKSGCIVVNLPEEMEYWNIKCINNNKVLWERNIPYSI